MAAISTYPLSFGKGGKNLLSHTSEDWRLTELRSRSNGGDNFRMGAPMIKKSNRMQNFMGERVEKHCLIILQFRVYPDSDLSRGQ